MTRVAAIDVGTNTVRLLVADQDGPHIRDVIRDLSFARLGEGVDAARTLGEKPMRRAAAAVETYVNRARAAHAERIRIAATSAVRDAANAEQFCSLVHELTRISTDVISGGEEARLAFAGATSDRSGPAVTVDIGGGSTEFVFGVEREVHAWTSLDVGAVRLTERHIHRDPPAPADLAAIRAEADEAVKAAAATLAPARAAVSEPTTLLGLAGTITTVAGVALGLEGYDRDALDGTVVTVDQIAEVLDRLAAITSAERLEIPAVPHGREDVIVAGAVLLKASVTGLGFDRVTVSEADILDGLALSLL